jgi:hypothetical protein
MSDFNQKIGYKFLNSAELRKIYTWLKNGDATRATQIGAILDIPPTRISFRSDEIFIDDETECVEPEIFESLEDSPEGNGNESTED